MLQSSESTGGVGGSGCCSRGGGARKSAKKPVRKYVRKGGNTGDSDGTAETSAEKNKIEDLYTNDTDDVQEGGAKKKKGSKVAAKKALSPYNKFVKKHFAILKKQFPDEKAPQIMQKVAIEWNKTKK